MEAIAVALFLLLFGAAAIGKDIDIIHISTPQRHSTAQVIDHLPKVEVPRSHVHEQ